MEEALAATRFHQLFLLGHCEWGVLDFFDGCFVVMFPLLFLCLEALHEVGELVELTLEVTPQLLKVH